MSNTLARYLLLGFGVFMGSTAVILIKACGENPMLIAAYRLLIAAATLTPLFLRERQQYDRPYGWRQLSWSALPGLLLAVHFITWNIGVHLTRVSNASLIVNTTPAVMPFFLWLVFRERVTRMEAVGTLVALAGLGLLALSRMKINAAGLRGDLICLVSMLCYAAYLALGRRNSNRLPLWLYMVPLYLIASLTCLLCALPFVNPIKSYTARDLLLILALGIVPTVGGHTILNYSMKHLRGQVVSIAGMGQILFATMMGYLVFREIPETAFYPTAALIVTGVWITLTSGYRRRAAATKLEAA